MAILSKNYLQNLEKHAIELALTFGIASKTFWAYLDDFHAEFGDRNTAGEFFNCLNSQDLQMQYTIEYENDNRKLNFLDVSHLDKLNYSYDFPECCNAAIANVQIKPHCNICPNITMKVFKVFKRFYPAYCTFAKGFAENGNNITVLGKVTKEDMNNTTSIKEK